ncbi:MAG TPA: DUF6702 family protein [Gemmatimonadales bacterium]|nr:DUF6702 family protein [Gemmatimonadales bacterium]
MGVIPVMLGLALATMLPRVDHPVHAARVELATAPDGRVVATVLVYAEDFPPGRDLVRIGSYLERHLVLHDASDRIVTFKVLHARPVGDRLRITLCSRASPALSGGTAQVTILQERFDDQVNVLLRHQDGSREEFVFVAGDAPTRLP